MGQTVHQNTVRSPQSISTRTHSIQFNFSDSAEVEECARSFRVCVCNFELVIPPPFHATRFRNSVAFSIGDSHSPHRSASARFRSASNGNGEPFPFSLLRLIFVYYSEQSVYESVHAHYRLIISSIAQKSIRVSVDVDKEYSTDRHNWD